MAAREPLQVLNSLPESSRVPESLLPHTQHRPPPINQLHHHHAILLHVFIIFIVAKGDQTNPENETGVERPPSSSRLRTARARCGLAHSHSESSQKINHHAANDRVVSGALNVQ